MTSSQHKKIYFPSKDRSGTAKGFTLIELMIVVALLGIFAAIAVPSFTQFINNNRTQSANSELLALLQFARSTAVAERTRINASQEDGAWTAERVSGSVPLRSMDAHSGVTITSSRNDIIFHYNGTTQPTTISICNGGDNASGFTISVKSTGGIRTYPRGKSGPGSNDNMDTCTASGDGDD